MWRSEAAASFSTLLQEPIWLLCPDGPRAAMQRQQLREPQPLGARVVGQAEGGKHSAGPLPAPAGGEGVAQRLAALAEGETNGGEEGRHVLVRQRRRPELEADVGASA